MKQKHISIPFKFSDANVDGMAKVSSEGIILEFEDKFFGLIKTGIKEINIPVEEIERINFKKTWFTTKLEIWLNNFQTLSQIPKNKGRIILELAKE